MAAVPLAVSAGAAAPAAAQDQPADDMAAQRANRERVREALAKVELPMSTEPAFVFKP